MFCRHAAPAKTGVWDLPRRKTARMTAKSAGKAHACVPTMPARRALRAAAAPSSRPARRRPMAAARGKTATTAPPPAGCATPAREKPTACPIAPAPAAPKTPAPATAPSCKPAPCRHRAAWRRKTPRTAPPPGAPAMPAPACACTIAPMVNISAPETSASAVMPMPTDAAAGSTTPTAPGPASSARRGNAYATTNVPPVRPSASGTPPRPAHRTHPGAGTGVRARFAILRPSFAATAHATATPWIRLQARMPPSRAAPP